MPGQAEAWWDDLKHEAELPPEPPRSKAPLLAGGLAAVLASAGLAWWLTTDDTVFRSPAVTEVRPRADLVRLASAGADQEQVRRAYEEFATVYADSGAEGLERFRASCEASLKGDPRILDYCLAFGLFAETVQPQAPGSAGAGDAERLAMVRAALPPGGDAAGRILEGRQLMRRASGLPPVEQAAQTGAADALPPAVQKVSAQAPAAAARLERARQASKAPRSACRLGSTTADRIVCANPALETQHRRMRLAYERALAAGADPLIIDRAQADWRAARDATANRNQLTSLYSRRIRELETAAANPPRGAAAPSGEPAAARVPEEPPI
jgi:hypothetical protein